MNESERLAQKYLEALCLGRVEFEPDGNIPPDFSIDRRIAVEVRRLNQNYTGESGEPEGLESLSKSLSQWFQTFLPTLGPSADGECWYVFIKYFRPLGELKPLKARVKAELETFIRTPERRPTTIRIASKFELELAQASMDHGSFFVLGINSDRDAGGFVLAEIAKNLRLCIEEKQRKIAPYRSRYPEWWLVLDDRIDFGLEPEDQNHFRSAIMPTIPHSFDKIVLLDPRGNGRAFEV